MTQLVVVFIAVVLLVVLYSQLKKQSRKPPERTPEQVATQQQRDIEGKKFGLRPLMNKSEYRLYQSLVDYLHNTYPYHRVFPQVAMGAYLKHEDKSSYMAINSKRADFLIIDGKGIPAAVVELQGSGHSQGNYDQRDDIKRQAVKSTGIPFIELAEHDDVRVIGDVMKSTTQRKGYQSKKQP